MVARRRVVIALGGGALAAPLVLFAQQTAKLPRIGVLMFAPTNEAFQDAFRAALRDYGYVEGQNILVEWRSAQGIAGQADALAMELVRLKVDVIVATPTQAVQSAQRATSTVPIVMAGAGDPVATGFVTSLARPGGNITGTTTIATDMGGKLLELIRELQPAANRIAVLAGTQNNPFAHAFLEQVQAGARRVGVQIQPIFVRGDEDLDEAFAAMIKERASAVIFAPLFATRRTADLAMKHRLPSITTGVSASTFAELGGLMSYGPNPVEIYGRAVIYVDKILRGAKPDDLPVEQPTKFEFIVNMRTAKALGIKLPNSIQLRADKVIE